MTALFACRCRDSEAATDLRQRHLHAHLDHVTQNVARYAVAGPLKDGAAIAGSLLIIRADSEAEARAFLETDPYFVAGVWDNIEVDMFLAVAGDWVGGITW